MPYIPFAGAYNPAAWNVPWPGTRRKVWGTQRPSVALPRLTGEPGFPQLLPPQPPRVPKMPPLQTPMSYAAGVYGAAAANQGAAQSKQAGNLVGAWQNQWGAGTKQPPAPVTASRQPTFRPTSLPMINAPQKAGEPTPILSAVQSPQIVPQQPGTVKAVAPAVATEDLVSAGQITPGMQAASASSPAQSQPQPRNRLRILTPAEADAIRQRWEELRTFAQKHGLPWNIASLPPSFRWNDAWSLPTVNELQALLNDPQRLETVKNNLLSLYQQAVASAAQGRENIEGAKPERAPQAAGSEENPSGTVPTTVEEWRSLWSELAAWARQTLGYTMREPDWNTWYIPQWTFDWIPSLAFLQQAYAQGGREEALRYITSLEGWAFPEENLGDPSDPATYRGGRGNTWDEIRKFLGWYFDTPPLPALTDEQIAAARWFMPTMPSVDWLITLWSYDPDYMEQWAHALFQFYEYAAGLRPRPSGGGGGGGESDAARRERERYERLLARVHGTPAGSIRGGATGAQTTGGIGPAPWMVGWY